MLRNFVNRIVELAAPTHFEIRGQHYANCNLTRIPEYKDMPESITVNGLDSVCKLVRKEADAIGRGIFIQIESHDRVKVFSTYDEQYDRSYLYKCCADTPGVTVGRFQAYENAVIELRSLYIPNEGSKYLLDLLKSITSESKIISNDNGVTQTVEAKRGIAMSQMVEIKPRVALKPFRTFVEVEQPESEFLLRISDDGEIGLYEADGGVWKLEATRNVAKYFEKELKDLIEKGQVTVIR